MPLHLFRSRMFSVTNVMTLLVYGALGAMLFFLVLQLQVSTGYTPLQAGLSTVPLTLVMLALSPRSSALAAQIGARAQLSVGPVLCGLGALLLAQVGAGTNYFTGVLPGLLIFSTGLVCLVAPLTSSVLAAAPDRFAGIASGINNALARTGSLLSVAALPAIVGIAGEDYQRPALFTSGYQQALIICAVLLFAGGLVSFVGLREAKQQPAVPVAR
jgi:MFS family permease